MIKHLVLLQWKEGTSEEQIAEVSAGFAQLAEEIAEIDSYQFGPDAGIYRGNADYALVAEFASEADLKAYVIHPKHQQFMSEVTGPIMAAFQSIQFEC